MSQPAPARRRAVLRQCAGLAVLLALPLPAAGPASAEPAAVLAAFTVAQLTSGVESRFYPIEPGQGSLQSDDGLVSDLLPGTNRSGILETLGPPDAVRSFAYSYNPDHVGERVQNRHVAGMVLRNALTGWRDSRKWVGRALIQAEKIVGLQEISETVDGYWITVGNPQGRVILSVRPLDLEDTVAPSLGLSQAQLLAGLDRAFPRRDAGRGNLYNGPGSISDNFFSDNAHAALETLGPAEDLIALRYLYALRDDDHPEATRDNRSYAFALLRNVFPDWAESEAWLQAAIDKAEREANRSAEPSVTDRAGIRVQVGYFVGATESIEIKVFPKGVQI